MLLQSLFTLEHFCSVSVEEDCLISNAFQKGFLSNVTDAIRFRCPLIKIQNDRNNYQLSRLVPNLHVAVFENLVFVRILCKNVSFLSIQKRKFVNGASVRRQPLVLMAVPVINRSYLTEGMNNEESFRGALKPVLVLVTRTTYFLCYKRLSVK